MFKIISGLYNKVVHPCYMGGPHFTHIICNVQDYIGLYNKVVRPVIWEVILLILYVMIKIISVFIIK